jgi:hypothetical protein
VCWAAVIGMIIGFTSLMLFIRSNASVVEAALTGSFRGTVIETGTGKYFHLSLMLNAASMVFAAYLIGSQRFQWTAILPVLVAAGSFWILGGRLRSLTPFLAYLLLRYYKRGPLRLSMKKVLLLVLLGLLLLMVSIIGRIYRGNVPFAEFVGIDSSSGFFDIIYTSLIMDLGLLYAMAGAVAIGPGVLGGKTFLTMLWPLSKILGLGAKSAGMFVVETLVGFDAGERKWGFQVTLIGDTYLNFGLTGVILLTILFGIVLKAVYGKFRQGLVPDVFFVLFVIYSILYIFYGSIEKFREMLIIFAFAIFVIKLGEALRALRRA